MNEVPALVAQRAEPYDPDPGPAVLTQAQAMLCQMVMDAVHSPNTRRNYQKALADLFGFSAGRPLTRRLLFEYRPPWITSRPSRSTSGSPRSAR